jgi:cysteine desulfurase family protein (TIGR01976 family)
VTAFDVEALRAEFPSLATEHAGRPVALFDGPGGTQVPQRVIDAVARYYREANANNGGAFLTSERSDRLVDEARVAVADLLNAPSPDELTFGANMTTLTFHVSRSIGATLEPGDEVVVSGLDHQANVDPWLLMARDRGVTVRTIDVRLDDCTLDLDSLDAALSARTKLVAVGLASNAVGTINPVVEIARRARSVGALTYVDAVHFAPHGSIDVQELGADFLVCSAYKFFGPHAGVLWGRREILDALPPYKVRPAHHRFETGTPNFEGTVGTGAAVEYLASIGGRFEATGAGDRRGALVAGFRAIRSYEMDLYRRLADGLDAIPGVRTLGITDRSRFGERCPTASIAIDGVHPRAVAEELGQRGIAVWDGDFYATGLIERLGFAADGGVVRIGLVHYNTATEVDRLLEALEDVASGRELSTTATAPAPATPA